MKRLLVILLVICILTFIGCSNTEEPSETTEKLSATEAETSTVEKYDYANDSKIVWLYGDYTEYEQYEDKTIVNEYGKVSFDATYMLLGGYWKEKYWDVKSDRLRLHSVMVTETSGKTCEEFYNNYIKNIDAPNEFSGLSEDELVQKLKERNKMAVIYVFLNQEQVESIISAGCPEDMAIELYWYGLSTEYIELLGNGGR